jgi:hypothetical protein
MAAKLVGGCACGKVRYRLTAKPLFTHCCHCTVCQRMTGSAFVINAMIEASRIKLTSGAPEPVRVPASGGAWHAIFRCPDCQTGLWSQYGKGAVIRYLRVGTLDDAAALPPQAHIFVRSKLPWLTLPPDAETYRTWYDRENRWPTSSLQRLAAAKTRP